MSTVIGLRIGSPVAGTSMIGSAAPSENAYHVQLDGDTAQSPTQLDTLNGGITVDTSVGFLRIGKH